MYPELFIRVHNIPCHTVQGIESIALSSSLSSAGLIGAQTIRSCKKMIQILSLAALAILTDFVSAATIPTYGQCGGSGFTATGDCTSGSYCQSQNAFYCASTYTPLSIRAQLTRYGFSIRSMCTRCSNSFGILNVDHDFLKAGVRVSNHNHDRQYSAFY